MYGLKRKERLRGKGKLSAESVMFNITAIYDGSKILYGAGLTPNSGFNNDYAYLFFRSGLTEPDRKLRMPDPLWTRHLSTVARMNVSFE